MSTINQSQSAGKSDPAPEYVLGTNEAELHRLGFQHRLWSVPAQRLWERAGVGPGAHILDVGCGPGFASLDLAQMATSSGRVVGVDESSPFVAFANEQSKARKLKHAQFHVGDVMEIDRVLEAQHIKPGSFDVAYVRWVLCFVPDPAATISAIAKMLKPGGRLCVQDYFRYNSMSVAPLSNAFATVINAVDKSWRDQGGDPDIMGRLPRIAIDAGLSVEHIARIEIGTARPGSQMWNWPDSFWKVFLPRLEELNYISADEHRAFLENWKTLSNDPAAYMHLPPVYEMIAIK